MKVIYLLRHAKSSWADAELDDVDRPLNARGRKAAQLMGRHMAANGWSPALILCSAAERARETLRILGEAHGGLNEARMEDALYLASSHDILNLVRGMDNIVDEIMIVGHNPELELAATELAGTGEVSDLNAINEKYPTAALAILDFQVNAWREVRRGGAHLRRFVRPRDLEAA